MAKTDVEESGFTQTGANDAPPAYTDADLAIWQSTLPPPALIQIDEDLDASLTGRKGEITIGSDFYKDLFKDKNGRYVERTAEELAALFVEEFGPYEPGKIPMRDGKPHPNADMLITPGARAYLMHAIESPGVAINIMTRNRPEYAKALLLYQQIPSDKIKVSFTESTHHKDQMMRADLQICGLHYINLNKKDYPFDDIVSFENGPIFSKEGIGTAAKRQYIVTQDKYLYYWEAGMEGPILARDEPLTEQDFERLCEGVPPDLKENSVEPEDYLELRQNLTDSQLNVLHDLDAKFVPPPNPSVVGLDDNPTDFAKMQQGTTSVLTVNVRGDDGTIKQVKPLLTQGAVSIKHKIAWNLIRADKAPADYSVKDYNDSSGNDAAIMMYENKETKETKLYYVTKDKTSITEIARSETDKAQQDQYDALVARASEGHLQSAREDEVRFVAGSPEVNLQFDPNQDVFESDWPKQQAELDTLLEQAKTKRIEAVQASAKKAAASAAPPVQPAPVAAAAAVTTAPPIVQQAAAPKSEPETFSPPPLTRSSLPSRTFKFEETPPNEITTESKQNAGRMHALWWSKTMKARTDPAFLLAVLGNTLNMPSNLNRSVTIQAKSPESTNKKASYHAEMTDKGPGLFIEPFRLLPRIRGIADIPLWLPNVLIQAALLTVEIAAGVPATLLTKPFFWMRRAREIVDKRKFENDTIKDIVKGALWVATGIVAITTFVPAQMLFAVSNVARYTRNIADGLSNLVSRGLSYLTGENTKNYTPAFYSLKTIGRNLATMLGGFGIPLISQFSSKAAVKLDRLVTQYATRRTVAKEARERAAAEAKTRAAKGNKGQIELTAIDSLNDARRSTVSPHTSAVASVSVSVSTENSVAASELMITDRLAHSLDNRGAASEPKPDLSHSEPAMIAPPPVEPLQAEIPAPVEESANRKRSLPPEFDDPNWEKVGLDDLPPAPDPKEVEENEEIPIPTEPHPDDEVPGPPPEEDDLNKDPGPPSEPPPVEESANRKRSLPPEFNNPNWEKEGLDDLPPAPDPKEIYSVPASKKVDVAPAPAPEKEETERLAQQAFIKSFKAIQQAHSPTEGGQTAAKAEDTDGDGQGGPPYHR